MRADVAQLVEHKLPKLGVAGSNPVVRSSLPLSSCFLRISEPLCGGGLQVGHKPAFFVCCVCACLPVCVGADLPVVYEQAGDDFE